MLDTVLSSTTSYNITVSSTASFGNLISATSGGDGDDNNGNGAAGTVSGTGVINLGSSAGSRTGGSINGSFCLGGTWLNSTGGKGKAAVIAAAMGYLAVKVAMVHQTRTEPGRTRARRR